MKSFVKINFFEAVCLGKRTGSIVILGIVISLLNFSCKKFIEVETPPTKISAAVVFDSDNNAIAVINGLYSKMIAQPYYGEVFVNLPIYTGLSSDELTLWSGVNDINQLSYYKNSLSATVAGGSYWVELYGYVFICNTVIEELNRTIKITPEIKNQLLGEAKFLRAFFFFQLVNLYGDIPLVTATDYKANQLLARSSESDVIAQITNDLIDAQAMLASQYLDGTLLKGTTERVRPNKWVATALLAEVYLYSHQWKKAEQESTNIIENTSLFSLTALNDVFLKNSRETIWQLQPTNRYLTNTQLGKVFILPTDGPDNNFAGYPVYLSDNLLGSFEINDQRKSAWINSVTVGTETYFFPFKYKVGSETAPVSEYRMMFRLAEQYLIRAEARANLGNTEGAKSDIDVIRGRAGLPGTMANSQPELELAILKERQVELFTENNHRWFDLRRTGLIDQVMSAAATAKGTTWKTTAKLYPIVYTDIQRDPNLKQNPGY